jgi:hypothetical protein
MWGQVMELLWVKIVLFCSEQFHLQEISVSSVLVLAFLSGYPGGVWRIAV